MPTARPTTPFPNDHHGGFVQKLPKIDGFGSFSCLGIPSTFPYLYMILVTEVVFLTYSPLFLSWDYTLNRTSGSVGPLP